MQHPFMLKVLEKLGIKGTCLKAIEIVYREKHKVNSPKIKKKMKLSTLNMSIQYITQSLS